MFISRRVPTALQVLTLTSGINLFAANVPVKLVCSMKDDNYTCTSCCRAQIYRRDAAFMTSTISLVSKDRCVLAVLSSFCFHTFRDVSQQHAVNTAVRGSTHRGKVRLRRTWTPTEGMSRSRESKMKEIQTANIISFNPTPPNGTKDQQSLFFFLTVDSSHFKTRI